MKRRPIAQVLLAAICLAAVPFGGSRADDWPHWMGPGHDNVWRETGLVDEFPAEGLPVVWRTKIAGGYAGPAVAKGRVFVTDYVTSADVRVDNWDRDEFSGMERVLCLDAATGDELWKHEYPVKYGISYPAGPRCTPTVHNGRVYTLGAEGHLFCLDVDSGDVVWSKDFNQEYDTKTALWGYASHPLVDDGKLICIVGGEGSHAVAFDLDTGDEIWRALTSPAQGYSPPTIIEAAGVRQLMFLRPDAVTSVNPKTGEEYWSVPYQSTNHLVVMSPVRVGSYLFVGGYNKQNLLLKLASDRPGAEVVWGNKSKHGMSPVNAQPFVDGDIMYGCDHSGILMAVSLPSGERLWETPKPVSERPVHSGTVLLVRQADRYWLFNEQGELILARLSPEGYQELARTKLIEPTNNAFGRDVVWCMPAFANRRLYVRNDQECICVDLSAP
jgi:outer membrane protein assembly factor BamB